MQKTRWIALLSVVVLSLAVAACSDTTADDGYIPSEGTLDGEVADLPITDGPPPTKEYKYVMIEDLSSVTGAQDGADIDAVELMKSGATTSTWAQSAVSCKMPGDIDCANPAQAAGASDAFCTDPAECFSNFELPTDNPATLPPYVALGGAGGKLILLMAEKIENGDTLTVYEVGNCAISEACGVTPTINASPESIWVKISETETGPWIEVLAQSDTANHPKIEITLSAL